MSKESIQKQADSINEISTLITKLSNFRDAIRDYDRLRLQGALFLSPEEEEYQEFEADMDGICAFAQGPAGKAVRAELSDTAPLDLLREPDESARVLDEDVLRAISLGLERALVKAQDRMQKVLMGE